MNDKMIREAHAHCDENRDWTPDFDLFRERVYKAKPILEKTASRGETITYGELAERLGTDKRRYMSCLLDGVGYLENAEGRPPLTAIVVNKAGDKLPSEGFEVLLEELGVRDQYNSKTEIGLYHEALAEVYDYWFEE